MLAAYLFWATLPGTAWPANVCYPVPVELALSGPTTSPVVRSRSFCSMCSISRLRQWPHRTAPPVPMVLPLDERGGKKVPGLACAAIQRLPGTFLSTWTSHARTGEVRYVAASQKSVGTDLGARKRVGARKRA